MRPIEEIRESLQLLEVSAERSSNILLFAIDELERLRAEKAELVEALRPFIYGCEKNDTKEEPPCGDCDVCLARAAFAKAKDGGA